MRVYLAEEHGASYDPVETVGIFSTVEQAKVALEKWADQYGQVDWRDYGNMWIGDGFYYITEFTLDEVPD